MFLSRISLLQDQVADLQRRLDKAEQEKLDLLNRLLERHNVTPVGAKPETPAQSPIQVLSPFPTVPPEMEEPLKDSWINEETEFIIQTRGVSPELARLEAERVFFAQHKALT